MQVAEVVSVDVAISSDLPVAALSGESVTMAMQVVQLEDLQRGSHIAEPIVDVEGQPRSQYREQRARSFRGRQLDEAVYLEPGECVLRRVADKRSVGVVDPKVIRAREASGAPETVFADCCAAMATDVQEDAGDSVVAANAEQRSACNRERAVVARLAQIRRERDQQRATEEDRVDLCRVPVGVEIVRHRDSHDVLDLVTAVVVDVDQQALCNVEKGACWHGHKTNRAASSELRRDVRVIPRSPSRPWSGQFVSGRRDFGRWLTSTVPNCIHRCSVRPYRSRTRFEMCATQLIGGR